MSQAQNLANLSQLFTSWPLPFRNRIINGDFRVLQRGGGLIATLGAAIYKYDRWYNVAVGAGVTIAQSGPSITGSNQIAISGAAGNTQTLLGQRIESINIADLMGKTVSLSGWMYRTATTPITVNCHTATAKDNFSTVNANYQVMPMPQQAVNTWTRFSGSFTMPSGTNNGAAIEFGCGACLAGETIYFADVQLEVGAVATQFERKLVSFEIDLCQRYFLQFNQVYTAQDGSYKQCFFPVGMRVAPTVTANVTTGTFALGGAFGLGAYCVLNGTYPFNTQVTWICDAEL